MLVVTVAWSVCNKQISVHTLAPLTAMPFHTTGREIGAGASVTPEQPRAVELRPPIHRLAFDGVIIRDCRGTPRVTWYTFFYEGNSKTIVTQRVKQHPHPHHTYTHGLWS